MKYTIEDVARESGVSISTVSRVMNGNYPVKKETREKVEAAIEKLNYQPNPLARSLIIKKTNTIGVIVPGITNMFFTEVVYGIEKYAAKFGYDVLLSSSEGKENIERACVNKFREKLVDGIIAADPQTENMKNGFFEKITDEIPLICINGFHENVNVNFVISSEEKGANDELMYLKELGHKNIAFVRGKRSYSYDIKERIYKDHIKSTGASEIIINTAEGNSTDVVNNTEKMIMSLTGKYEFKKDITAFLTCNDLMAVGVLNALRNLDIKVPDEISIAGFDNIIISEMTSPKITTVDQKMRALGETAAQNLINLIKTESKRCSNVYNDAVFIKRESCAKR